MQTFRDCDSSKQKEIFQKFKSLRSSGFGYKRIRRAIRGQYNIHIPNSTVSYWCNHNVVLFGEKNKFDPVSSPELAYVLGVCFGDGCLNGYFPKQDYKISLLAMDKDFVEHFSSCLSVLLEKSKPFAVNYSNRNEFFTSARSKEMYFFIQRLKKEFDLLKPFIDDYPADFIRGLADSEGCPCVSAKKIVTFKLIVAVSTNSKLLLYVQRTLQTQFGILSRFLLNHHAGQTDSIIRGRIITRTKDLYALEITRKKHIQAYVDKIGFLIARKTQKVRDYYFVYNTFGRTGFVQNWRKLYEKKSNEWKRKNDAPISEINFAD